jgi:hypothetical protein
MNLNYAVVATKFLENSYFRLEFFLIRFESSGCEVYFFHDKRTLVSRHANHSRAPFSNDRKCVIDDATEF